MAIVETSLQDHPRRTSSAGCRSDWLGESKGYLADRVTPFAELGIRARYVRRMERNTVAEDGC